MKTTRIPMILGLIAILCLASVVNGGQYLNVDSQNTEAATVEVAELDSAYVEAEPDDIYIELLQHGEAFEFPNPFKDIIIMCWGWASYLLP